MCGGGESPCFLSVVVFDHLCLVRLMSTHVTLASLILIDFFLKDCAMPGSLKLSN